MENDNNKKDYEKIKLYELQEKKKRNNKETLYLMQSIKIIYFIIQHLKKNILFQFKKKAVFLIRINIFLFLFFPAFTKKSFFNKRLLEEEQQIIIIKVSNPGEQQVINSQYVDQVIVFINDTQVILDSNNKTNVSESMPEITLKFTSVITNMERMFAGLSNIIEIDFTYFNCSIINGVKELFEDCRGLQKITFSNSFGPITSMYRTFCNCTNLTSIDLSVFDTSQVSEMQQLII
jgi:surface protein